MKGIGKIVAAGWLIGFGASASLAGESAASGDVSRLQGKWQGRAGAAGELRVTMEFEGSRVAVLVQTPQGLTIRAKGEVKLDETTSPRRVDWVGFTAGEFQTLPEIQGVYKLEGDAFVLCNGGFNGARPEGFTPGDGPLADVLTFNRPEPPKVADARNAP